MGWVALYWSLAMGPAPAASSMPVWFGGRVLTTPGLHLGVRPAAVVDSDGGDWSAGLGVTVQLSTRAL